MLYIESITEMTKVPALHSKAPLLALTGTFNRFFNLVIKIKVQTISRILNIKSKR